VLLDASADASHRMAQEGLDWVNLPAIWISHLHLDHAGGLAPFLFGSKWAPQTQSRTQPLQIFGPEGLRRFVDAVDNAYGDGPYGLLQQPFPLELIELKPGAELSLFPGVRATTFSTPHTKESLAIRLWEESGKSFVYTSDTGLSEELIDFCTGATLLLIECSFRRNKPVEKHLELDDVMRVAKSAAPGKLVVTHLYPEWDGIDLVTEARAILSDQNTIEIVEARDGLSLHF
jgi:ribonuclease BN (tRNA processing enzyme)